MKYNIQDIKLRTVETGKRNAGSKFLQFTVVNPDDEWDDAVEATTFNQRMVKVMDEYFLPSQPSPNPDSFGHQAWLPSVLKDATKPVPEKFLTFTHAQIEEFVFPGGERVALDENNGPRRNEKGQFITRTSIRVLTKKTVDNETGVTTYAQGWDPVSQGTSIMLNFYGPMSLIADQGPTGVVLPQGVATPLINSGSTPTAQPGQPGPAPATAAPTV